jgi:hypothetical protein
VGLGTDKIPVAGDGQKFLSAIAKYDWDDGGAKAGALFQWIAAGAKSPDQASAKRAGESAHAVANFLSLQGNELLTLSSGIFG